MSDVIDLAAQLNSVNTTVTYLSLMANNSLEQLMLDQYTINSAWTELVTLNQTAEDLLVNFTNGTSMIDPTLGIIADINETYLMLRNNLTMLDMQADRLAYQLSVAMQRTGNLSRNVESANMSLVGLLVEVEERGREAAQLLTLLAMLNDSIQSLETAAVEAHTRANALMVSPTYVSCV